MTSDPILGTSLRVTRLDAEGTVLGEAETVLPVTEVQVSLDGTDEDWGAGPFLDYPASEPFTTEVTLQKVDADLLSLFAGGEPAGPSTSHAIEVWYQIPVRRRAWRVVWEWLCRTPRQYTEHYLYIPNARVSQKVDHDG